MKTKNKHKNTQYNDINTEKSNGLIINISLGKRLETI